MSDEERMLLVLNREQVDEIAHELMRRTEDLSKKYGARPTILAFVHVAGYLAARAGFGGPDGVAYGPSVAIFRDGFSLGVATSGRNDAAH